jgi:hypothetical protein
VVPTGERRWRRGAICDEMGDFFYRRPRTDADDIGSILHYDDIELIRKRKRRDKPECEPAAAAGRDEEQRRSGRPNNRTKQSTAKSGEIASISTRPSKPTYNYTS